MLIIYKPQTTNIQENLNLLHEKNKKATPPDSNSSHHFTINILIMEASLTWCNAATKSPDLQSPFALARWSSKAFASSISSALKAFADPGSSEKTPAWRWQWQSSWKRATTVSCDASTLVGHSTNHIKMWKHSFGRFVEIPWGMCFQEPDQERSMNKQVTRPWSVRRRINKQELLVWMKRVRGLFC